LRVKEEEGEEAGGDLHHHALHLHPVLHQEEAGSVGLRVQAHQDLQDHLGLERKKQLQDCNI